MTLADIVNVILEALIAVIQFLTFTGFFAFI